MNAHKGKGYIVKHIDQVGTVLCPCGSSTRIILRKDTPLANLHVTHIQDSKKLYHQSFTEYYYILEGAGHMELGGRCRRTQTRHDGCYRSRHTPPGVR